MKTIFAILTVFSLNAFASARPAYISANIVSITHIRGNLYNVTYQIQKCTQDLLKVQEIQVPDLQIGQPGSPETTNASIAVILEDKGLACMGPVGPEEVVYQASKGVLSPQPLKQFGQNN